MLDGMQEVPMMMDYDLRSRIFEYLKEGNDNEIWDGRTSVRISSLSKSIVSIVDKKYNINSKTKTITSLLYIGCFRMLDTIDKDNWNKFLDNSSKIEIDAISLCDLIGTEDHGHYYNMRFSLNSIGYKWVDNLQAIWPIADKKRIIYHMYNDHRIGNMFDIVTDIFGFSVKEAANMFILFAIKNSDILHCNERTVQHLQRIDRLINYTTVTINNEIECYNTVYYK